MEITVAVRENSGTRSARRSRKNGEIPGVIYGEGKPTEHLTINARDFGRLVSKEGTGKLIELKMQKGKTSEKSHVLIKDIQRHPVQGAITHVDFLRVAMDHPVTVKVPLHVANDEKKTRDGGIIELLMHDLEVSCLPSNIPDRIQIQVVDLTTGGKIHVKDLELGQGIKAITPLEETVVQVVAPTVAVEAETTEGPVAAEPEVVKEKKEEA
ncbi:MAG: 50S ribosomal protein L25 [Bacteroidota bacterium]